MITNWIERTQRFMELRWSDYMSDFETGALHLLLLEMRSGDRLWLPSAQIPEAIAICKKIGHACFVDPEEFRFGGEIGLTKKGPLRIPIIKEAPFVAPPEWGPPETWPANVLAQEKVARAAARLKNKTCKCGVKCETVIAARSHCARDKAVTSAENGARGGRPRVAGHCFKCGAVCVSRAAARLHCRSAR